MSINHYYSSDHLPEAYRWSHYIMESSGKTSSSHDQKLKPFISSTHLLPNSTATFCPTTPHHIYNHRNRTAGAMAGSETTAFSFNLNNEDEEELVEEIQVMTDERENNSTTRELEREEEEIPKEPLFEKPLTPSDVGKLNRLVIPKQHAEKHFPLNGGGESGENGLLLSFEDEVGKSWRFRYSYWNSSQSYVLTKGWSRFVKEKRLDAGDIVIFARHRVDVGRFFIGWRRRNSSSQDTTSGVVSQPSAGGGGGWSRVFYSSSGHPYPSQHHQTGPSSLPYQPEYCLHAGSIVQNQTTTTGASGNSKRLRLFGVNLECESEPSTPVGSPMSSQSQSQSQAEQQPYHSHHQYYSNHMDINFSGADIYRQG